MIDKKPIFFTNINILKNTLHLFQYGKIVLFGEFFKYSTDLRISVLNTTQMFTFEQVI